MEYCVTNNHEEHKASTFFKIFRTKSIKNTHRASWLSFFFFFFSTNVAYSSGSALIGFFLGGGLEKWGESVSLFIGAKRGGVFASVNLFGIGADTLLQEERSSLF